MELQLTNTKVKVSALPTQKADDPRNETDEASPPNSNGRGAVDRSHTKESLLTPKSILTVGCWNVRTLYATGVPKLLLHELEKIRWDIMGIFETH